MGGKALQSLGIETERKSTADLLRIFTEIKRELNKLQIETHLVRFYRNKETHGDLDILLKIDHTFYNKRINLKDWIKETYPGTVIFSNGSVLSFEYENFQVDLIPLKESNWEVGKCFFDYDPSGNLMGKVAHKFGLKYGFEGIVYPYRTNTGHIFGDILISKDNAKIFNFLGFSYNEYLKGFDTIQEVFDFIIYGKYFNKSIFDLENLNHIDRKRNRKRESYKAFLEYLPLKRGVINFKNFDFKTDKSGYFDLIETQFPESNFLFQLNTFKEKERIFQLIRSKFNGKLVMDWYPELTGKDLGLAMGGFKTLFEDFDKFILDSEPDTIKQKFVKFFGETGL